jgi:alpha-L-fucosidase 2
MSDPATTELPDTLPVPERGFISERPAKNWEEGLITGNGTLGLNAYSRPHAERIIFSHEELFMPMGAPFVPKDQSADLPKIRQLIAEGKYKEAERLQFENSGQEGFMYPDFYVPAFDLTINRKAEGEIRNYARSVDFSTAEATVQWTDDAGTFRRQVFASREDGVAVICISASEAGSIHCDLKLEPRESSDEFNKDTDIAKKSDESFKEHFGDLKSESTKDSLSFSARFLKAYPGSIQSLNGLARVIAVGGEVAPQADGSMSIAGADEVLILADIRLPRQKGATEFDALAKKLEAIPADYDTLLERHVKLHGEIFNRVKLDIGGSPEDHRKSTEELLKISTWQEINKALIEKQFDAGRYNILCSTGKLPPNLQGVWGGNYVPNWASDYTHNGNVPSAIAANLPGNMPELTTAYTTYIESLIPDMELNARHFFGARGIVLPSRSSTNGYNNALNPNFAGGMWVSGAGKAARFFYDYYLFTGDKEFLAQHTIPYLEKCALFFEDYLYEGPDGKWIFSPTQSPENWPAGSKSQATYNATMDVAVAKEVFTNLIKGSRILGVNEDKIPGWEKMLAKMPPYMLNEDGIIKEWLTPRLGNNDKHRHSSQLYPLYYVMPDEIADDPELKEGFRKSVEFKLAEHWKDPEDRGFMSFGLVQLGQVVSTLGDSELSYLCLRHLVNRFWLNNLASMHNHRHLFNMDISGGQPALIIQMLVGSDEGEIHLLPALPKEWPTGSIEGVLCRGAIEIERLEWTPHTVKATMVSQHDQTVTIKCAGSKYKEIKLPAGQAVTFDAKR